MLIWIAEILGYGAIIGVVVLLTPRVRARRNRERRLCVACGYRLDGLALEGRCPECGGAYSLPPGPVRLRSRERRGLEGVAFVSGCLVVGLVVVLGVAARVGPFAGTTGLSILLKGGIWGAVLVVLNLLPFALVGLLALYAARGPLWADALGVLIGGLACAIGWTLVMHTRIWSTNDPLAVVGFLFASFGGVGIAGVGVFGGWAVATAISDLQRKERGRSIS